jgi:ADP-ribosyl-[dinitrogen reductase] hydrolase
MARVSHQLLHGARGAIVGAAVGEALARSIGGGDWPTVVLGGAGELSAPWGDRVEELVSVGEVVARGESPAFDVGPVGVIGVAVADAVVGRGAPLLADPEAAEAHGVIGSLLGQASGAVGQEGPVAEALKCADEADFPSALRSAWALGGDVDQRMVLAGGFAGARLGVTAVPSRWLTYVHGPGGRRVHHQRDLLRLADRLVGHEMKFPPDPRRRIGPVEVVDGVWAANAFRVPSFCTRHPDGAVISMCPMGDALDGHPIRRTFLIDDVATRAANPRLEAVVDELLATIAAFRSEGREVLVHCHHGVSRTGLALRAWLIDQSGFSEPDATSEAEARWPWLSTANSRFTQLLQARSEG